MPVLSAEELFEVTKRIFEAMGAPKDSASKVAEHLVEANLMGHDSHGVVRILRYLDFIRSRETLRKVASQVDFFILNDAEAKLLAQTDSISSALRILKANTLIVTLGELGAIVSSLDGFRQLVPAFVVPSSRVVDTTGAGDTWCGAFLAAYMLTEDLTKAVTFASVVSGIKCSGWGMENLVNLRFKDPDDAIEYVIGLREGRVQKKISDYV